MVSIPIQKIKWKHKSTERTSQKCSHSFIHYNQELEIAAQIYINRAAARQPVNQTIYTILLNNKRKDICDIDESQKQYLSEVLK